MSQTEEQKRRFLETTIAAILVIVVPLSLLWIGLSLRSDAKQRERIVEWLDSHSGPYKIRINGSEVGDSTAIVAALKTVTDVGAHHSHPAELFRVEVMTDSGSLELILGRDSERPDEYWVFPLDRKRFEDLGNEIGRVTTATLAPYSGLPPVN
jgi:hypothetical protein